MLKLIQITDSHLTPAGTRHLGLWPRPRFEAAIRSVNAEHGDAALVVITGDLAALGQTAATASSRRAWPSTDTQVFLVPLEPERPVEFVGSRVGGRASREQPCVLQCLDVAQGGVAARK